MTYERKSVGPAYQFADPVCPGAIYVARQYEVHPLRPLTEEEWNALAAEGCVEEDEKGHIYKIETPVEQGRE